MKKTSLYGALVFGSGFAALLYQVCWQRVLHTIYGTATQATAVIVSIFMLGLGVGAWLGGRVAQSRPNHLLPAFALCELLISILGAMSLRLSHAVSGWLAGGGVGAVALGCAAVLLVPTTCMGASLPLLATHALRFDGLPGRAVARFSAVNTLGAAASSVVCVVLLLGRLGLSGTVHLAAGINLVVALGAWRLWRRG